MTVTSRRRSRARLGLLALLTSLAGCTAPPDPPASFTGDGARLAAER